MNEYYRLIASFIIRMGMYIYPIDKYNIMSFLTGYQIDKESFFSERIKRQLESDKISCDSLGIIGQIQKYSDVHNIDWNTAFIQIGLSIVAKENSNLFQELKIGNRIRGIIYRIESPITAPWIQDWLSFCNFREKWFCNMWSESEFDILKKMDVEIENYCKQSYDNDNVNLSEELLQLKELFYKQ